MNAYSGKSIIEEWANPPGYPNAMLRSDQLYEERAVDVVIGQDPRQNFSNNTTQNSIVESSTINRETEEAEANKENIVKIKRPRGGATVRSIPIKDYRASIAQNMGTLRKAMVPEMQFESLVSEPEKALYVPTRRRSSVLRDAGCLFEENTKETAMPRISNGLPPRNIDDQKTVVHSTCRHWHRLIDAQDKLCCNCAKSKCLEPKACSNQEHWSPEREKPENFADLNEYFRRSSSRRYGSKKSRSSCRREEFVDERTDTATANSVDEEIAKVRGNANFEKGHVGQKIFTYEENVRRSKRNCLAGNPAGPEVKKYRTIGVPLVGMHNACGLPVLASWHEHEFIEPVRISGRMVETLRPVFNEYRVSSRARRRTHPKRKAPQPVRTTSNKICSANLRSGGRKEQKSSSASLEAAKDRASRRKKRQPSFKTSKVGTLSSKASFQRSLKVGERAFAKRSSMDTLGSKSLKEGNAKRTTLYARDAGEDAVQVLKSLCLNPLARTKSETDMIW